LGTETEGLLHLTSERTAQATHSVSLNFKIYYRSGLAIKSLTGVTLNFTR
jgi:hypothetical protein